jgi:hypothetical protein
VRRADAARACAFGNSVYSRRSSASNFTLIMWIVMPSIWHVWPELSRPGVATKEVAANVNLPPLAQDGFHADELPVAGIPLVVAGKPNDPSNPTLRLQPWNSISVFDTNMRAYIPNASQVQFTIDSPSGSSVIELDPNGIIHPRKIGTATVKAQYADPTNPLVTLTGQVQVNVVDKQQ